MRINDKCGIMSAHVTGETFASDPSHLCADHLDCAHERIREQEGPAQGVPELRAGLRIGRYTAGIVVRSARNEARPHDIGELRPVRLFNLLGGRADSHAVFHCPLYRNDASLNR